MSARDVVHRTSIVNVCGGGSGVLWVEQQRERRAAVGRATGVLDQLQWELRIVEDRVAPLVQPDPFGEQLGAQPVRDAIDPVDAYTNR
jgi:hypothetical protein